ncbi:hypothetical protein LAJ19_10930 [Deinococcus taeanensis]|uniref:hypothetical protein n=1 Tax=Deinococcus taeanensis TaxID=2737050 RepID=UPI001CDC6326|nr:hypothetical protein [Deinococcus taeanensis]UBV42142.1 hypothetical protein LAJ19_10930 [Deinococcus taeanensis]
MTQVNGWRVPAGERPGRVAPPAALAATAKPTVIVWKTGGQLAGDTPAARAGRHEYRWTHGKYGAVLTVGGPPVPGGERAGRLVIREALLAFTLSTPR